MAAFKKVLKMLRTQKGLTQDELAGRLKISKSAISMYENGNREPDFETLENIADYFNVDMNYLMGWEDKDTAPDMPSIVDNDESLALMRDMYERPELRALFKTSRKVKPDDIKAVDDLLKRMAGGDDDL